jgi:hypothetical protein
MSDLKDQVMDRFFDFYRSDIDAEIVDPNNVVISFPVHFSGFHRIEVTVSRINEDRFVISDGSKTIEELKKSGYRLNRKFRERLESISRAAQIRVVNDHLVADSDFKHLGSSIQRFLEAAKTIGDAYLSQTTPLLSEKDLAERVSSFLYDQQIPFQRRHALPGKYEAHTVDFYYPPNGVPGLALSVINNPSKTFAEAWAYRAMDIRDTNKRLKVGVVYDDEQIKDKSEAILKGTMDVSIPGSHIEHLGDSLREIGIVRP